jgi:hypothetical protein
MPTHPVAAGKHVVGYGAKQLGHVQHTLAEKSQAAASGPGGQPAVPFEAATPASDGAVASPPPLPPLSVAEPFELPPDPPELLLDPLAPLLLAP